MKIISWNVNGIAACRRKGFLKFLTAANADIICCQEVKTRCNLVTPGYLQYWNNAERSGYSGTLTLTRREPLSCKYGFGIDKLDTEGRLITLEYKDYYVINVYVPSLNTYSEPERFDYRNNWDCALREYIASLPKPAILAGDFNITRETIDSYPKIQSEDMDDILFEPESKVNFENLLSSGLVDTFRSLYPEKSGAYTWWGPKNRNRIENKGSRLDYFLVSEELLPSVRNVKFHTDIQGSDHCPISMIISPAAPKRELDRGDLAVLWRSIDWQTMREELFSRQKEIAQAAYYREWRKVEVLQKELLNSWVARALAVQTVVDSNSEVGVDGVRWTTDEQKAQAALSLNTKGYRPLPYRHTEIVEKGKTRIIHVPTSRDKAMLALCAFAVDPVAESTADHRSFFARKGRSLMDLHAYLYQELYDRDAPEWVVVIDVRSFYGSIAHEWLLDHIVMDKEILRVLLKAGVVMKGDLFPTEQGISLGTSLSPILGNMILDGLQSRIFDCLFPNGRFDYSDGKMFRFADDILVLARSEEHAKFIMQVVEEFLAERGLRINHEKSFITNVHCGFDFLSRHYQQKNGILYATPADKAIIKAERELENLIMNFKGTQRQLIDKINQKLNGLATYHRVTDAYMDFRHIDAVVEGLLVDMMCRKKYKHWKRTTVLKKFWIKEGDHYVFALPDDPSYRVKRIAPLEIVKHKPCKLSFNPYLDWKYYSWLQERRDVQKANGKYYAIWTRQSGRCAYCGQAMLPDQEVEIVEKVIGNGRHVRNLQYIHRQCTYDSFSSDEAGEHINLFSLLDGITSEAPAEKSPYMELTEYFRLCKKPAFTLTFKQIESILGDTLCWEAYNFKAFWFDDEPGMNSPMWQEEGYSFQIFIPSKRDYCICDSWLSQGYEIKALYLTEKRVVFHRVNNDIAAFVLPKALTTKKIPKEAVYECQKALAYIIAKYGL